MSDITKVRIGIQGARELELEVEDAAETQKVIEAGIVSDDPILWVTDTRGHRYGLATDKLAFVEIEGDTAAAGIGFGVG